MAHKPSIYQQGVYNFIKNRKGNAVVDAVAGSGKTTTLLNALKLIPSNKRVLFLAFNKSIAKELSQKVPNTSNIHVKTVHGFGFSCLNKYFNCRIEKDKYHRILNDVFSYHKEGDLDILKKYNFNTSSMLSVNDMYVDLKELEIEPTGYFQRIIQLCDLGRMNLIDIRSKKGIDQLNEIAKNHSIEIQNGECFRAWHLIKIGSSFKSEIDFTDMIYLPIKLKLYPFKYDFVFIDECQDLNACQRTIMLGAVKPKTGRFIAVGDPSQAIYGFAGADANSFKTLSSLPKTKKLPLSVCYRCGKNIIKEAQSIVPHLEAFEGAIDGSVEHNKDISHIKEGDMVLCRQTYPLFRLCLILLSQNKAAKVMGTDIGASLIKNINDTKKKREDWTLENMFNRLYAELDKVLKSIMRKEDKTESEAKETKTYATAKEKISVIEMLAVGLDSPLEIIEKIKTIFNDDNKPSILLSTIHKSKGLEADRVFIIHPELMPSKYAELDWEIEQEDNLKYVAYTRAKSLLAFIPKSKFDAWGDSDKESQEGNVKNVVVSEWVGKVGEKEPLELTITFMKNHENDFGTTTLYIMEDQNGNVFEKWGFINERFLKKGEEVEVGSVVSFKGMIKQHKEYHGEKATVISSLSKI